jgi:acyl-homoserine lactone synthase
LNSVVKVRERVLGARYTVAASFIDGGRCLLMEVAMIHIVTAENLHLFHDQMEQAFRLRHAVFVEEMKWEDLRKPDGRETDQFDDDRALHMLYVQEAQVLGYQRLLPTIRPHLLSEIMPDLCEGTRPVGPNIWEWTRYCVSRPHRERGRTLSPIANALLSGIVEWGLESGVDKIIIEMDPIWVLRLVQLYFRVTPLGLPKRVSTGDVVAVVAAFDVRTRDRLRDMRGDHDTVLVRNNKPRVLHA